MLLTTYVLAFFGGDSGLDPAPTTSATNASDSTSSNSSPSSSSEGSYVVQDGDWQHQELFQLLEGCHEGIFGGDTDNFLGLSRIGGGPKGGVGAGGENAEVASELLFGGRVGWQQLNSVTLTADQHETFPGTNQQQKQPQQDRQAQGMVPHQGQEAEQRQQQHLNQGEGKSEPRQDRSPKAGPSSSNQGKCDVCGADAGKHTYYGGKVCAGE